MLVHPQFNPVALSLGPLQIHWYGLTYLVGFGLFLMLATRRARLPQFADLGWQRKDVEDMLFYGVVGVVGMSFHGGLLGVMAAMVYFAARRGRPFLEVMDLVAPCVPTGLAAGRIGNFINGELWGRAADPSLPWAMVFPQSGTDIPRHPSQIYQFLLEGLLLFALLWWYGRRPRARGQVGGAFVFGYGVFRFIAEYFREPDRFLGLLALNMSMGQWLCVPMIVGGAALWWWCGRARA
jgi:phosphatidylglycerol:prolipoprotein diacylglycerol transferase